MALAVLLISLIASVPSGATTAGAPDPSFGTAGMSWVTVGVVSGGIVTTGANAVAIQQDQKIVVGGFAEFNDQFILARFNPDGSLDTSFGTAGVVRTDFSPPDVPREDFGVRALALLPGGDILAGGSDGASVALAEYLPDGSPDPSFGTSGVALFPEIAGSVGSLFVAPDGTITLFAQGAGFVFARVDPAGVLSGQVHTVPFTGSGYRNSFVTGAVARPGGGYLVAGDGCTQYGCDGLTVAFTGGGLLDHTFGSSGIVVSSGITENAVALQPNGKFLLGGRTCHPSCQPLIWRLDADGSPDHSFGNNGTATFASTDVSAIIVQGTGGFVVADPFDSTLHRFFPAGKQDPSFVSGGLPLGVAALTLDVQGRIVAAGSDGGPDFAVARYLSQVPVATLTQPRPSFFTLSSTIPVSWVGANGATSFDARYEREGARGGYGSWVPLVTATTQTSASLPASPGSTTCLQVEGSASGITGPWSAVRCVASPLDDRALSAGSGWTRESGSGWYHGTYTSGQATGSALVSPSLFRIVHLSLVVGECPTCGSVSVYMGSTHIATLSLRSARPMHEVVVPVATFPTPRSGAVSLKISSSTGSVQIDGLAASRV
jgi:uncharacterized delta-60 repeat protein